MLANAGITYNGAYVGSDNAAGWGGSAKALGGRIKMAEYGAKRYSKKEVGELSGNQERLYPLPVKLGAEMTRMATRVFLIARVYDYTVCSVTAGKPAYAKRMGLSVLVFSRPEFFTNIEFYGCNALAGLHLHGYFIII